MKRPPAKRSLPRPPWKSKSETTEELATELYRVDPEEEFEDLDELETIKPEPEPESPPPALNLRRTPPPAPKPEPKEHVSTLLLHASEMTEVEDDDEDDRDDPGNDALPDSLAVSDDEPPLTDTADQATAAPAPEPDLLATTNDEPPLTDTADQAADTEEEGTAEPDAPVDVPRPRPRTTTFPVGGPIAVADPELWDDDPFFDAPSPDYPEEPSASSSASLKIPEPPPSGRPTPPVPLPAIPDDPAEIRKLLAEQKSDSSNEDEELRPTPEQLQARRGNRPPTLKNPLPLPPHGSAETGIKANGSAQREQATTARLGAGTWGKPGPQLTPPGAPIANPNPESEAPPTSSDEVNELEEEGWQQRTLHGIPSLAEGAASRPPSNQLARLPPPPVPAGSQVAGRYRVMGTVRETPYGLLIRAVDEQDEKQVYLQLISRETVNKNGDRATLASRARSVARFRHENLVSVLDSGEHQGAPFFTTEYVHGPTLADLISKRGTGAPPTIEEVFRILYPLSRALDALHEAGVTHGAIRPDRIIIGPQFRVVLDDLGPASLLCGLGDRSDAPYQAPEVRSRGRLTPAADLYSLAIIAYTLFSGEAPPVPPDDYRSVVLPSLRAYQPQLPIQLDRLLQAAIADDPSKRPSSPKELIEKLDRALDDERGDRRCSRILIVDRDPSVHRFLVPLVARSFSYSVEVDSASSFEDARSRILTHKPGLVIAEGTTDSGGPMLLDFLKNRPRGGASALIVTVPEPTPERALALEFNTQLRKPLDPTALITAVRRMFGVSGDGHQDPSGLVVQAPIMAVAGTTASSVDAPPVVDTADTIVAQTSNNRPLLMVVAVLLLLVFGYLLFGGGDEQPPAVAQNQPAQVGQDSQAQPANATATKPPPDTPTEAVDDDTDDSSGFGDEAIIDVDNTSTGEPENSTSTTSRPNKKIRKKQKAKKQDTPPPTGQAASSRCARVRKAAKQASKMLDWNGMLRQIKKKECWSSSLERRKLKTKALMELKRFGECVRTGSGHPDPKVKSWVALCKKRG